MSTPEGPFRPQFPDLVSGVSSEAAQRAHDQPERSRSKLSKKVNTEPEYDDEMLVIRVDPAVWKYALEQAGDDPSRIEINLDGSVTIHNRSRFER